MQINNNPAPRWGTLFLNKPGLGTAYEDAMKSRNLLMAGSFKRSAFRLQPGVTPPNKQAGPAKRVCPTYNTIGVITQQRPASAQATALQQKQSCPTFPRLRFFLRSTRIANWSADEPPTKGHTCGTARGCRRRKAHCPADTSPAQVTCSTNLPPRPSWRAVCSFGSPFPFLPRSCRWPENRAIMCVAAPSASTKTEILCATSMKEQTGAVREIYCSAAVTTSVHATSERNIREHTWCW